MERLQHLLREQPALIAAVVEAGLAMLMAFGLNWDAQQLATVVAFVNLVGGIAVYLLVMPMSKVKGIQDERDVAFAQAQEARDLGAWLLAEQEAKLGHLRDPGLGPLQQPPPGEHYPDTVEGGGHEDYLS